MAKKPNFRLNRGSVISKNSTGAKIKPSKNSTDLFNELGVHESKTKAGVAAFKTGFSSAMGHFSKKGNWKKAGISTLQTSAVSAAAHGGLAAIQGEDPWEAAKSGAIRGAFVGGGYQFAKAATGARSKAKGFKGIKDNVGQIITGGRDIYRAHTVAGNAAMRQTGVSNQLKRVLQQKHRNDMAGGIFGLKTNKQ